MEVHVHAQIKNGLLYRAVQKCGSQKRLGEYLGVGQSVIGRWLRFLDVPGFRNPTFGRGAIYADWDQKLIALIGYGLEEVFPAELEINKTEIAKAAKIDAFLEMPIEQLALVGVAPKLLPSPDERVLRRETHELIQQAIETLPQREQDVLALRFGLDGGGEHTYEEIGQKLCVTRERIRQIEAKALRNLRHPQLSRRLKLVNR